MHSDSTDLSQENAVLREQVQAQQDMLDRTTQYMEEIQARLEESEALLKDRRDQLEEEVKARTAELEATNTKLRKALRQKEQYARDLKEAYDELNSLMYRASHDLRAPINNLEGLTQLLKAEGGGDPDALTKIEQANALMLEKIDRLHGLLYFQSLTEPQTNIEVGPTIKAVFETNRKHFGKTESSLNLVMPCQVTVEGPFQIFEKMMAEIIANAFQFAKKEAPLKLSVRANLYRGRLKMAFQDNGKGLPPDHQHRVWQMFTREHETSKTGIGLFLVQKLVKRLRGSLSMTCGDGTGATVFLTLPVKNQFELVEASDDFSVTSTNA